MVVKMESELNTRLKKTITKINCSKENENDNN